MFKEEDGFKLLGKSFSTSNSFTSTAFEFFFWKDEKCETSLIEPGTMVFSKQEKSFCFGVIGEVFENMDYNSSFEAFMSHDFGKAKLKSPTERFSLTVCRVEIIAWSDGGVKPLTGEVEIFLGTKKIVEKFLGVSEGFPVGFLSTPNGKITEQSMVVKLPHEYVFGTQAQGVNVGGKTGYAKTNLSINLALLGLFYLKDLAVVGINVKGQDLLWIDKLNPELSFEDLKMWEGFGVKDLKWIDFKLLAPKNKSFRTDEKVVEFTISFDDVKNNLNLLFAEDKKDENAIVLLNHLAGLKVPNFEEAILLLKKWEVEADAGRMVPGSHHPATIKKVIRKLTALISKGFVNKLFKGKSFPDVFKVLRPKSFVTFDLNDSKVSSEAQKILFQKIVNDLKKNLESGELFERTGVKRVLLFVDELSKYAGKGLGDEAFLGGVKSGIRDVAERGRFSGLSLLGVEQYPSQVDESILQNMATMFFTRLKPKELSNELYKYYPTDFRKAISSLPKGVALIDHDTFTKPFFIKFPRSLCATQKPPTRKQDLNTIKLGF